MTEVSALKAAFRTGRGDRAWRMLATVSLSWLVLAGIGCAQPGQGNAAGTSQTVSSSQVAKSSAATAPEPNLPPAPRVNAARAMEYTRDLVKIGERKLGGAGHARAEAYIRSHLKGDQVEEDSFTASTPAGPLPVRNIIAKYPGTKDGVIVIASHYDTNYGLKDYVGANDGASTSALLLELANQLRGAGTARSGYSVWLVFLDAEEAVKEWSATDSIYGSRHLAEKWQKDGTIKKLKAFLLADMLGDADLNVDRDANSTPWLEDLVLESAKALGYQSHFFARNITIEDDHLPFMRAGVPIADLIDFDYGYGNVFHHTSQDTLDKLSPKSLEIAGNVFLETVRRLDAR